MDEAVWTEALQSHPIFRPPPAQTYFGSNGESSKSRSASPSIAVRQTDIIVAVGAELRILDLQALGRTDGQKLKGRDAAPAQFKTLRCNAVDFPVLQLAVNVPGTLLAAAGEFELAVVSLPKASYAASVETIVDCQGAKVGQLDVDTNESPIADVKWHPWAESYSTLLVLTQDAMLREYNVNADLSEPQQALSFLPKQAKTGRRRTGAFSIDAGASRTAVSFAIGKGEADWGPLTLYGLMENGDVWTVCPYLPQRAYVSQSYIDAMTLRLDTKAQVLRQSTSNGLNSSAKSRALAGARIGSQQRYIRAIADQIRVAKASKPREMDIDSSMERSAVQAPDDVIASRPARQGPFLLQPAPESVAGELDLGSGVEDVATDLAILDSPRDPAAQADDTGLTGLALLWKEGRVDMCLELDKVEALWDSGAEEVAPHALLVYESLDLELASALGKDAATALSQSQPKFTVDPLEGGTIYVTHAGGSHMIEAGDWLRRAQASLMTGKATSLQQLRKEAGASEVTHLFEAPVSETSRPQWRPLVIAADISLPYTAITCDASGCAVVVPLGETPIAALDSDQAVLPEVSAVAKDTDTLLSTAFQLESTPYRSIVARTRTAALQVLQAENVQPSTPIREIGARDLRCLGKLADVFAQGKNEIERTSLSVENRLQLQTKEVGRQLKRVKGALAALRALQGKGDQADSLPALRNRLDAAREKQADLLRRLDGVTRSLMQEANPELSIQETKWIEELERMKALVGEPGSHRSLQGRIAAAKALFEAQKTALPVKASAPDSPSTFGQSQLTRIEQALAEENASIATIVTQLGDLNSKMSQLKMRSGMHSTEEVGA